MNEFEKTEFIKSAASAADFPRDGSKQIIFAGRSNVGKSSVINMITGKKNFARVSSKPGKTVFVNVFKLPAGWMIDLPGYGFAKTSREERKRFSDLVDSYFLNCGNYITEALLLIDCRRDPMEDDLNMADYFRQCGIPFTVVTNKIDKLKPKEREESYRKTLAAFRLEPGQLIPVSAETKEGKDKLLSHLSSLF